LQRESWVHWETENDWVAAGSIAALQPEFDALTDVSEATSAADPGWPAITLDELRGFERFAPYSNEDLALLLTFCELVMAAKGDLIIRKGDLSDSMFLVLSGQVQARLRVGGHDTSLGTMGPGELFGEVAMLSQTARSADVVADAPSRLLRLSSERFQELMSNHSQLAARMLYNIARQLASRMSQRNQQLQKDLASSYVWR
jgi:CRP-like cAMP-binding protein